jgi:hypothetical protein
MWDDVRGNEHGLDVAECRRFDWVMLSCAAAAAAAAAITPYEYSAT